MVPAPARLPAQRQQRRQLPAGAAPGGVRGDQGVRHQPVGEPPRGGARHRREGHRAVPGLTRTEFQDVSGSAAVTGRAPAFGVADARRRSPPPDCATSPPAGRCRSPADEQERREPPAGHPAGRAPADERASSGWLTPSGGSAWGRRHRRRSRVGSPTPAGGRRPKHPREDHSDNNRSARTSTCREAKPTEPPFAARQRGRWPPQRRPRPGWPSTAGRPRRPTVPLNVGAATPAARYGPRRWIVVHRHRRHVERLRHRRGSCQPASDRRATGRPTVSAWSASSPAPPTGIGVIALSNKGLGSSVEAPMATSRPTGAAS